MNSFIVIVILVFTTLYGYLIINRFNLTKSKSFFRVGLGYGLGFIVLSMQLFLYSLFNLPWDKYLLLIPNVIFASWIILSNKITYKFVNIELKNWINKGLVFLILLLIVFVFFESTVRPLSSWDGWASWQMKSKMYFYDGEITGEGFQYLKTEYPLAVSLYSTYIYILLGEVDDNAILLISTYFYAMIGLSSFAFLKVKTSLRYSLIITFLLLSTQNIIRHGGRYEAGMADIVMAYFVLTIVMILSNAIKNKIGEMPVILFIFMGIITQIKNEGIMFGLFALIISFYFILRSRDFRQIFKTLWFVVPLIGWLIFKSTYQLPHGILTTPEFSSHVFVGLIRVELLQFLNIANWNLGWIFIVFAFLTILAARKIDLIVALIACQALVYFVVFFFSNIMPITHASGIIDRLFLHLYPAAVVYASLIVFPIIKNKIIT